MPPPADSTIVSELRAKGAIIYAKANLSEYNGGSGNPGGSAKATKREFGAGARSSWAGPSCNPYDTSRETGGSSSGSAASVAANLVACSICEETGGSCRQPAWRNDVVALVTTKGLMPYGGAIGADPYLDRAGIHCRTVQGRGARPRRDEEPGARVLRSARRLQRLAGFARLEAALRLVCGTLQRRRSQASGRRPHRHRPRVHGQAQRQRPRR